MYTATVYKGSLNKNLSYLKQCLGDKVCLSIEVGGKIKAVSTLHHHHRITGWVRVEEATVGQLVPPPCSSKAIPERRIVSRQLWISPVLTLHTLQQSVQCSVTAQEESSAPCQVNLLSLSPIIWWNRSCPSLGGRAGRSRTEQQQCNR